ncbi:MAG TPA: hypothetical protein VK593_03510 [Edaphobacter sp.]|nr:hypothetical protein [Edaphobacter sp.]
MQWPWFILWFCLAAVAASYLPRWIPQTAPAFSSLYRLGRAGLTVVLFLIGTGISRSTLKKVGIRPLAQGTTLWLILASLSLWATYAGWISLEHRIQTGSRNANESLSAPHLE